MIPGNMSLDQLREKLHKKLNPGDSWDRFIRELYDDRIIVEAGGDLFEATYTVSEDGEVEIGELIPVKVEYVAAKLTVALKAGTVPKEIQLFPAGRFKTKKGDYELTAEAAEKLVADFDARENDMVVDYEHQTFDGSEAPAAGWIKKLVNKGKDGLWAVVEWTDRAKEYIRNREYRYISPAFFHTKKGLITELINAALTNLPGIDGMVPVVNKADVITHKEEEGKMLKKLLKLLGLKDDATEEQALEEVRAMKATHDGVEKLKADLGIKPKEDFTAAVMALKDVGQVPAHKEVISALGLKEGASLSEVKSTIMTLKEGGEQNTALATKVKELEDKISRKEAEDRVAAALKAGKITPGQRDWALKYSVGDPEGFEAFVAAQPVVVELKELAGGGDTPSGNAGEKLTALTEEKLKADGNLTWSAAFAQVQKENPELAKQYAGELTRKS